MINHAKKMTILLLGLSLVTLFFTGTVSAKAQLGISDEDQSITNKIIETEKIRLTNPELFASQLEILKSQYQEMSDYQVCHTKYLENYLLAFQGKNILAINGLEQLLQSCEDLKVRIRINALLANLSIMSGDFEKSSMNIDLVIQNAEQTSDLNSRNMAYSAASIVYDSLGQKDLSQQYSQLLYNNNPNIENKCRAQFFSFLADIEKQTAIDLSSAYQKSIKDCENAKNKLFTLFLNVYYAEYQIKNIAFNDVAIASTLNRLSAIEGDVNSIGYPNLQALYFAVKARLLLMSGQISDAQSSAEKSLQLNQSIGNSEQLIIALKVLEDIATDQQDFERSYQLLNQRNTAEKEIFNQEQSKQLAFMTVKHSNLAKVFEIEQLNQQKSVLELEKKLAYQEGNNQRLIILLILTLLAMVLMWLFKIKKRHDYFKDVSEIDHLTKVLTRKAFEEQVNDILLKSKTHRKVINVAIMDLDWFKQVNDTHGHLIGDWVLKNVVYTIKEKMQENMIIARLGGEEFCIVMYDVSVDVMFDKAEQMRQAIETLDCSDSGVEMSVTASFGVSTSETSGYSLPMLLNHADVALFEAKNSGRNRVNKYVPEKNKG